MEERKKVLKLLETGKITADEATKLLEVLKHSFGRHHFVPCCHLPHKKVIVKMRDECCPDPEDIEIIAFGCCD